MLNAHFKESMRGVAVYCLEYAVLCFQVNWINTKTLGLFHAQNNNVLLLAPASSFLLISARKPSTNHKPLRFEGFRITPSNLERVG